MSDVERFDRWAATYERSYLQRLVFGPVHRTMLEVAVRERPHAMAILDVGCGTGRLLRGLEAAFPRARLEGVDASAEMVAEARAMLPAGSRIQIRHATAEKLPYSESTFDLVFSSMTFHHWAGQQAGIAEVARVLRPAGLWLLADFVATGFMRLVSRALRLRKFPDRSRLEPILAHAGLRIVGQHRVPAVGSQVPVLVIGLADQVVQKTLS